MNVDTLARACSFWLALLHKLEIWLLKLCFLSNIPPSSFSSELSSTIASSIPLPFSSWYYFGSPQKLADWYFSSFSFIKFSGKLFDKTRTSVFSRSNTLDKQLSAESMMISLAKLQIVVSVTTKKRSLFSGTRYHSSGNTGENKCSYVGSIWEIMQLADTNDFTSEILPTFDRSAVVGTCVPSSDYMVFKVYKRPFVCMLFNPKAGWFL